MKHDKPAKHVDVPPDKPLILSDKKPSHVDHDPVAAHPPVALQVGENRYNPPADVTPPWTAQPAQTPQPASSQSMPSPIPMTPPPSSLPEPHHKAVPAAVALEQPIHAPVATPAVKAEKQ